MRLRPALALLPLLLAASAPTPVARPALWKLADADTTIYLFGTVHVLPDGMRWRGPAVAKAIASAQSLTLETVLDTDPGKVGRLLLTLGRGKGLPPLAQRVPPARRAALAALIADSGLPQQLLDQSKSWAAAVLLTNAALRRIGIGTAGDTGVEPALTRAFRGAGKPVDGLETPEMQLGFFDALPEAGQRAMLEATLDSPAEARREFDRIVSAWAKGDTEAIARAFAEEPEFTPEARDLLIRRRDIAWANALARRLARPGTVLVAVGAGHLAGPDSVQRFLAAKGLKVVRVQ